MPSAGPTTIGRYEVVDRIGYGGVGVVYRARDPRIGRLVAIKLLRVSGDDVRVRFVKEAQSAGNLKHPNIVTVYDFGEHEGQPFIVMEFIEGTTLADHIRRQVPLSVIRKLELIEALAAGLGYAHSRGVVHRDVKPANLMIGPDGVLKILDFGIARTADSGLTQAGTRLGTLTYMSPEALQSGVVDRRSDIFAVGLVFYELLASRPAFTGDTAAQVIDAIVRGAAKPLLEVCPDLDPEVDRVVTRALEKAAARRYQTLDVMGSDIARIRERLLREADESPTGAAISAPAAPPVEPPRRRRLQDVEPERPHLKEPTIDRTAPSERAASPAPVQGEAAAPKPAASPQVVARTSDDEPRLVERVDRAKAAFRERNYIAAIDMLRQVQAVAQGNEIVAQLLHEAHAAEAERQAEKRKQTEIGQNLDRARTQLAADQLSEALASLDAVFAVAPDHIEALALACRLQALVDKRRRDKVLDGEATWMVEEARKLFDKGQHTGALALLRAFRPRHQLVTSTIEDLDSTLFDIARQRLERVAEPVVAPVVRGEEARAASPPSAPSPAERESQARNTIRNARNRIAAHDVPAALEELERFTPPHPLVTQFLAELRAQLALSDRRPQHEDTTSSPALSTEKDRLADTLILPPDASDER